MFANDYTNTALSYWCSVRRNAGRPMPSHQQARDRDLRTYVLSDRAVSNGRSRS